MLVHSLADHDWIRKLCEYDFLGATRTGQDQEVIALLTHNETQVYKRAIASLSPIEAA